MSLYEFAGPDRREIAHRAAVICTAILSDGAPIMDHFPAAGLIAPNGDVDKLAPFISKKPWPGGPEVGTLLPISGAGGAQLMLAAVIGEVPDWLGTTLVWVLPAPEPQVALGDEIYHGFAQGTRGFSVTWNGGSGFLTAGHVAPALKAIIMDSTLANIVGEVQAFADPRGSNNAPKRDVAVVEWSPSYPAQPPHIPKIRAAATGGSIFDIHRPTGAVAATVTAYASYWLSSVISGTYGSVYATTQCVTTGGDLGAPAVDAAGDAIGTVVAGIPGFATLVQDVGYQLAGMNTLPHISL